MPRMIGAIASSTAKIPCERRPPLKRCSTDSAQSLYQVHIWKPPRSGSQRSSTSASRTITRMVVMLLYRLENRPSLYGLCFPAASCSCRRLPGQRMPVTLPVEIRPGIGLAIRGNIGVPDDALGGNAGIGGPQHPSHFAKRTVLGLFEWSKVGTFQFDAN